MYYNKTIKLINILIDIIGVLITILSSIEIIKDFDLLQIFLIGMSIQLNITLILHYYLIKILKYILI